jgi:hypothetical protein
MKSVIVSTILAAGFLSTLAFAVCHGQSLGYHAPRAAPVRVSGHVTKAGTYIAPSYRTAPNRTKTDNWSSKPNVNPYTGKQGTSDPYKEPPYGG